MFTVSPNIICKFLLFQRPATTGPELIPMRTSKNGYDLEDYYFLNR
jgi:hypothetical protein